MGKLICWKFEDLLKVPQLDRSNVETRIQVFWAPGNDFATLLYCL